MSLKQKQYEALLRAATDAGVDTSGITATTPDSKFCELCKVLIEGLGSVFAGSTGTLETRKAEYLYQLAIASGGTPEQATSSRERQIASVKSILDANATPYAITPSAAQDWRLYECLYALDLLKFPLTLDIEQFLDYLASPEVVDIAPNLIDADMRNSNCALLGGAEYCTISGASGDFDKLCCWFKPAAEITTATAQQALINFGTNQAISFGSVSGAVANELITCMGDSYRSSYTEVGGSISAEWHYLEVEWQDSILGHKITLDGVQVNNALVSTPANYSAFVAEIGARKDSGPTRTSFYSGSICSIELYTDISDGFHFPVSGGLGMGLEEPDISGNGNDGAWTVGAGGVATLRSGLQDVCHANMINGFSLWEHSTLDPILVSYGDDGLPLPFARTGYTKTYDAPPCSVDGAIHNGAETTLRQKSGNEAALGHSGLWYLPDGLTEIDVDYAALLAWTSFTDNTPIKWSNSLGYCRPLELHIFSEDFVWTPEDYAKMLAYLGSAPCGDIAPVFPAAEADIIWFGDGAGDGIVPNDRIGTITDATYGDANIITLDGVGSFVTVPTSGTFEIGDTIEAEIRVDVEAVAKTLFSTRVTSVGVNDDWISIRLNTPGSNQYFLETRFGGAGSAPLIASSGTVIGWHRLKLERTALGYDLYEDGTLLGSNNNQGSYDCLADNNFVQYGSYASGDELANMALGVTTLSNSNGYTINSSDGVGSLSYDITGNGNHGVLSPTVAGDYVSMWDHDDGVVCTDLIQGFSQGSNFVGSSLGYMELSSTVADNRAQHVVYEYDVILPTDHSSLALFGGEFEEECCGYYAPSKQISWRPTHGAWVGNLYNVDLSSYFDGLLHTITLDRDGDDVIFLVDGNAVVTDTLDGGTGTDGQAPSRIMYTNHGGFAGLDPLYHTGIVMGFRRTVNGVLQDDPDMGKSVGTELDSLTGTGNTATIVNPDPNYWEPKIPALNDGSGNDVFGNTLTRKGGFIQNGVEISILHSDTVFKSGTPSFWSADGSTIDRKTYPEADSQYKTANGANNLWIKQDTKGNVQWMTQYRLDKVFTPEEVDHNEIVFRDTGALKWPTGEYFTFSDGNPVFPQPE